MCRAVSGAGGWRYGSQSAADDQAQAWSVQISLVPGSLAGYDAPLSRGLFRLLKKCALAFLAIVLIVAGIAVYTTLRSPVVAQYRIAIADWPAGAPPLRIVQLSDIHAAGPDMPPSRIARIVKQVNALRPDLVVITGDFVSDRRLSTRHYSSAQSVAPLGALRAPLGIYAVLGNHDHWREEDPIVPALQKARITLLFNRVADAGPILIAGLDDSWAGTPDLQGVDAQRRRAPRRPAILITHNPDVFPMLPADFALVLAGHTHGGQIRLPLIGPLSTASAYGTRFVHGLIEEQGRLMIVSAGLGTSILPFRLGVPPEIVVVTLVPANAAAAQTTPDSSSAPPTPGSAGPRAP